jgi:hypothetical protein
VIVGPDGTGKTSVADGLARHLGKRHPLRRFHHRLRVLPSSSASGVATTDPHGQRPYPPWLSDVKVLYLFVDELLGWLVRVLPFRRRGGWILLERGWWDLVVDPVRYRLQPGRSLAARLARFLPSPDTLLILEAPLEVINARKEELQPTELERQIGAWRRLARRLTYAAIIDAAPARDAVLRSAIESLDGDGQHTRSPEPRWVTLPPWRRPRWHVPNRRPLAVAGLSVYQPMTVAGRIGWEASRVAARLGAFRLLPSESASPVIRLAERYVPDGGGLAVAYARDPSRAVALIMGRDGELRCAVKIALEPSGRAALAREAERLQRLGSLLEPPLLSPAVLDVDDGILVLEAVSWRPRRRPWLLPEALARGIGRFHARLPGNGPHRGPGHGDFAPWNVMLTPAGWMIVDWEEADEDAPPYDDPFHYLVQAHALLGHPRLEQLLAGLRGEGWIGRALSAYADAAGMDGDAERAFVAYVRRSMALQDPNRADGRRGLAARQRLLAALASADGGGQREDRPR